MIALVVLACIMLDMVFCIKQMRAKACYVYATEDQLKRTVISGLKPETKAAALHHEIADLNDVKKLGQ